MTERRAARGRGTPPRPAGRRTRRKGKGRRLPIVLAFLGVVAAGMSGLALYLGFVPGPGSLLGARDSSATPTDSMLAAAPLPPGGVGASDAAALDTAVFPATAGDSAPAVVPADSAAGDAVYHGIGRCVGCHGATGEGAPGLGPALDVSPGRLGDGSVAAIARVVASGAPPAPDVGFRVAMPSYAGQLSADDVTRVAAYVHTLSHPTTGAANADTQATGATRTP